MQYETILVSCADGVGTITLNRPQVLNAMNLKLIQEMDRALTMLEEDSSVGAIIITGAGDRAFSAGADIHENVSLGNEGWRKQEEKRYEYVWHIANCRKPTIGAINGLCYGGGTVLATALDLRIGCERTSFRFLAAVYGQINATWTLPLVVGWPKAKELLYTGREVLAEEAYQIGLLNHLVPSGQLMDKALEIGRLIASNNRTAVQGLKHLFNNSLGLSWRELMVQERTAQATNYPPPHVEESFKDFLARKGRRDPAP